jgi:hypothetical protein
MYQQYKRIIKTNIEKENGYNNNDEIKFTKYSSYPFSYGNINNLYNNIDNLPNKFNRVDYKEEDKTKLIYLDAKICENMLQLVNDDNYDKYGEDFNLFKLCKQCRIYGIFTYFNSKHFFINNNNVKCFESCYKCPKCDNGSLLIDYSINDINKFMLMFKNTK